MATREPTVTLRSWRRCGNRQRGGVALLAVPAYVIMANDAVDDVLPQLVEIFGDSHPLEVLRAAARDGQGSVERSVAMVVSADGSYGRERGSPEEHARPAAKKPKPSVSSPGPATVPRGASGPAKDALQMLKWTAQPARKTTDDAVQLDAGNITEHVPCELYPDFIPDDLADDLIRLFTDEADSWDHPKFYINEKEVFANHKAAFYADDPQRATLYFWSGEATKKRTFSPVLARARDLVQAKVRERLLARDAQDPYVNDGDRWTANVAVANEYANGQESFGPHSDKLTYIGPRPVIASLTLGAGRTFRFRRIPRHNSPCKVTYNVVLPNRSLLVMFAPTQEEFKHELPRQKAVVTRHPICGAARYNITFRMYKDEFRVAPQCRCGVAMELKPVFRTESVGRYYWTCTFGRETGCGAFQWLDDHRAPRVKPTRC
ncbi:hypothetical protein PBRA_001901 [Plasmodiophora brassicae]|uniref:Uncharacterized protein n=1 Tax=Plasmodiophora brassicae TaxID=37360 RepID=A0A0G4J159_PLABS|nr:hypothetical protein PBRA_001901 [Plasmodiophora brassicae]